MQKEEFINQWNQIFEVSEELKAYLRKRLQQCRVKKGERLYSQGQQLQKIYFISSGLLVGHRFEGEKNTVCWFLKDHDFIEDHNSFLYQKPAKHTVIATENSVLLWLSYRDALIIYHTFPEANFIAKDLLNYYLNYHQKRTFLLTISNSAERYYQFTKEFAWAVSRLKRGDIASFLNMSPETLSRIR